MTQDCPAAPSFSEFFERATLVPPYPYQSTLAALPIADRLISAPTGMGKTAAVILAWLWQLRTNPDATPRRLVYCLPMRVLVEQTAGNAALWVERSGLKDEIGVHVLMGGEVDEDWERNPEKPAILVGTQDMLLSRALNRGYATSRYKWPLHFGLLNNDALWVIDETQLMGAALPTTTQLAAMRRQMGHFGGAATWWMSATLSQGDLETYDFKREFAHGLPATRLESADVAAAGTRLNARKNLLKAPALCRLPEGLAEFVLQKHTAATQSIVIVNRVRRAREVFHALRTCCAGAAHPPALLLLHSRFRAAERQTWTMQLATPVPAAGRIVVATQVIEAGIDLSSALMVTDLAPYANLVQRFGRCNRAGEYEAGDIYWIDRPLSGNRKDWAQAAELKEKQFEEVASPYSPEELRHSAELLATPLTSANSLDLPPAPARSLDDIVLRRRDLLDLFDTTPDLSGLDADVSRFIRAGRETDVYVAWRPEVETSSASDIRAVSSDELCPVPIGEIALFLQKKKRGQAVRSLLRWDHLQGRWSAVAQPSLRTVCPGSILLAPAEEGGYSPDAGWDADSWTPVPAVSARGACADEAMADDPLTRRNYAQTLEAHARETQSAMRDLLHALGGPDLADHVGLLLKASLLHDVGKAHPVFQATLHRTVETEGLPLLAKSTSTSKHARPYFRHELASALALLQSGEPDLLAYLAAAHHGKVRLSIRSFPDEQRPRDKAALFARGIWEGDTLPPVVLDGWSLQDPLLLDLDPMLLGSSPSGSPSWVDRVCALRDSYGPFRLAYLEALVRVADARSSDNPKEVC